MSTAIKRASHASCPVLIANRIEFRCTNMSGRKVTTGSVVPSGWLIHPSRQADLAVLREDLDGIDYVVYSYDTPIAWHHATRGWYRVKSKFTVTTSKHQGRLYMIDAR